VNILDLVLVALVVLAGITGYRRGLALQTFGFGGLLLGLVLGAMLAPAMATLVDGPAARAGIAAAVLIVSGGIGNAIGWLVGSRARTRTRTTRFGPADAVAGSIVAVAATLLAIWFLALNLVNGPLPTVSEQIRGSGLVRTLDAALPEPPSLLAQARQLFNRFGFPDVFAGLPPPPADPVRPPTQAQARAAVTAAAASTVRVVGIACDSVQEGSAFVVAEGHVVTNAHVVAGVSAPEVRTETGAVLEAETVLFDPDLDLAILRLAQTPGPVLDLATEPLEPGAGGAVLGFPEGGPIDARRAALVRTFEAIGRDIYGREEVERLVLELQTVVRPGNSGGPFVLADGRVGGVVFAASSSDAGIGYAIAADEVDAALEDALETASPTATGPCVR
jgi:S1-C subfamily serine protease